VDFLCIRWGLFILNEKIQRTKVNVRSFVFNNNKAYSFSVSISHSSAIKATLGVFNNNKAYSLSVRISHSSAIKATLGSLYDTLDML